MSGSRLSFVPAIDLRSGGDGTPDRSAASEAAGSVIASEGSLRRFFQGRVVKAVACDLDGTLTTGATISDEILAGLGLLRACEVRLILATGRTVRHLDEDFPLLRDHFDIVVAENGAVLGDVRLLAAPLDTRLFDSLRSRGVSFEMGVVVLSCSSDDVAEVRATAQELGIDIQIVRNRASVMVLPPNVTKGTGVWAALDELGIAAGHAVAFGDAENDLPLLRAVEVGIAVADAVPELKAHADLVLDCRGAAGVAKALRALADPHGHAEPPTGIPVGRFADGRTAAVPSGPVDLLITGASGSGKSHLAGLFAEECLLAHDRFVIFDRAGDHVGLRTLPGVSLIDGRALAEPRNLWATSSRGASIVIDLSQMTVDEAQASTRTLLRSLVTGVARSWPALWLIFDEAQEILDWDRAAFLPASRQFGWCYVTYRPDQLPARLLDDLAVRIEMQDVERDAPGSAPAVWHESRSPGEAMWLRSRRTPHARHWHKYSASDLRPEQWFYFCDQDGSAVAVARGVLEFASLLQTVDDAVLAHHLSRRDFSAWFDGSLKERRLASVARDLERFFEHVPEVGMEGARIHLSGQVASRYRSVDQ